MRPVCGQLPGVCKCNPLLLHQALFLHQLCSHTFQLAPQQATATSRSLVLQLLHQLGVAPADHHQLAVGANELRAEGGHTAGTPQPADRHHLAPKVIHRGGIDRAHASGVQHVLLLANPQRVGSDQNLDQTGRASPAPRHPPSSPRAPCPLRRPPAGWRASQGPCPGPWKQGGGVGWGWGWGMRSWATPRFTRQ